MACLGALCLYTGSARCQALELVFDRIWAETRDHLEDTTLASRHFTKANYSRLREKAQKAEDIDALAGLFNPFLDSLHVSHTHLSTASDLEYYAYAITASPRQLDTLEVFHIGIQYARVGGQVVVRNVFEGYPAERAGVRRGDVILTAGGRPFHPFLSFASSATTILTLRRNGRPLVLPVTPVHESLHRSLLRAMQNSLRRISVDGHRIAYLHLWTCISPVIGEEFARIVRDSLTDLDGVILDLRDGVGGWWFEFTDPFFEDRRDYPVVTISSRAEEPRVRPPEPAPPHPWFQGPMVAIVNEGTRSGKEGMAFQFKKSRRARLVGTATTGAFMGASFTFGRGDGYVLAIAATRLLLDGVQLEGVGVAPDVAVAYPLDRSLDRDPQLERAVEEIGAMLRSN